MLSVLCHVHSLRFAIPAVVIMGVAPQYLSMWMAWRILSSVLPRRIYDRGDEFLFDMYQSLVCFFFETYTGAEVILYGDSIPWKKQENVLYLSNHQCTVDWVVAFLLAVRQGSLGRIRYIMKNGLKHLPVYGFYLAQHGCIFVKRSGQKDQDYVRRKLEVMKQNGKSMWLVIFPEGTRYNLDKPDVIKESQQFAADKGFPVLSHVLTPRTRGTEQIVQKRSPKKLCSGKQNTVCLEKLSDYLDAVYDITIAYKEADDECVLPRIQAPSMPDFLSMQHPQIHVYCHRHEPSSIPQDEEGRRKWVYDCFAEKDRILGKFYNDVNGGILPGVPRHRRLSLLSTTPYFVFWSAVLLPFIVTKWGRSVYWKLWLVTGIGSVSYMTLLFDKIQG